MGALGAPPGSRQKETIVNDETAFRAQRLDHVALRVRDLDHSTAWYEDVLCLEERYRYRDTTGAGAPPVLCSGDACLALFPREADTAITPLDGHIAFRLDRANFDRAREHLRRRGIAVNAVAYDRCDSLYFRDPDGYEIELSTYER
jgi:catechol 2,3-dioxygenase-like lactoylglutathione lyase family enzyme